MQKFHLRATTVLAGMFVFSITFPAAFPAAFQAAFQANAQTRSNPIELDFLTHVGQGIVEQDVFIEREAGSGELFRVAPTEVDEYGDFELFAAAERVPYQPFDPVPGGPYAMGRALGVTLREWLAAEGTASYWCDDGTATVTASFDNLVPDGLYTVWYVIRPDPPTNPFTGLLSPIGERDGAQSIFTADGGGHVDYQAVFEPCLEMSGTRTLTVVGVSWHSDGQTYGFRPGPFGQATHTQINAFFPKDSSAN